MFQRNVICPTHLPHWQKKQVLQLEICFKVESLVAIPAGHLENSQRSLDSPPRRWLSTRPPQPPRSAFLCFEEALKNQVCVNVLLRPSEMTKLNSVLEIVYGSMSLRRFLLFHWISIYLSSRQNHFHSVHTSKLTHHPHLITLITSKWSHHDETENFSFLWHFLTDDAEKRKHFRQPILTSILK